MTPGSLLLLGLCVVGQTEPIAAPRNLNALPSDLRVPEVTDETPQAGRRVRLRNEMVPNVAAVLYLPPDWRPDRNSPVLVEFPPNGGFQNKRGDRTTGQVEDCKLGFGLSGGQSMIWLCLPFIDPATRTHPTQWWGDPDATAANCRETVRRVCREFGGDPDAVILMGFSRGALACGYIGLRDDETAKLWRALFAHSHYDGVRRWSYPDSDVLAARQRLSRLGNRPQFVSHEESVEAAREFVRDSGHRGPTTFLALPYPNHSADWVLKDLPERKQARAWLTEVLKPLRP